MVDPHSLHSTSVLESVFGMDSPTIVYVEPVYGGSVYMLAQVQHRVSHMLWPLDPVPPLTGNLCNPSVFSMLKKSLTLT